MSDIARPRQFATIEAGRGIAALIVVLFHAGSSMGAPQYWHTRVFGGAFEWGFAGVFFFFVLSGFIIMHVHVGDIGRRERLGRYVRRRFMRIYPLYWIILAGILCVGLTGIGVLAPPDVVPWSLLLVGPDSRATVVAVAWTLYHEILFYAVFASWIADVRLGAAVTLAWAALILAGVAGVPAGPAYLGATVNLLFGFGIAAWWASRRTWPAAGWIATAAAALFVAIGIEDVTLNLMSDQARELAFGAAAALGVGAVVSLERRRPVTPPRLLLALGAASYSIYLTHFSVITLFSKLAVAFGLVGRVPPEAAYVVTVVLTVAAGYAFHRLIERPLLAWLR